MNNAVLQLQGVGRTFRQAGEDLPVLRGCDLTVQTGECVALIGPSGSGKSTLLHIAGLLEKADFGQIFIAGKPVIDLGDSDRTLLRRQAIGFVYQYHYLLPEFSARENIILPQMLSGISHAAAGRRADELLEKVGLLSRASHRPGRLSGGEQQRVAIARGLANSPKILIADEPTGNLDPHTADIVFELLKHLAATQNIGLLMATHNLELARKLDRTLSLQDGTLKSVAV